MGEQHDPSAANKPPARPADPTTWEAGLTLHQREETFARLTEARRRKAGNPDLFRAYARALFNLSTAPAVAERREEAGTDETEQGSRSADERPGDDNA